jgi:RNA polymerase sigma-70 factor (ECF subfamily)
MMISLRPCESGERAIVEAACRGEVDALAGLYERYYATMVWVAYSVLLDRPLAEDAAQQTFATAYGKIRSLRQPDRLGSWLAAICRNTAQDMARARRREAALQKRAAGEARLASGSDGFDTAVKDAVDNLPVMYREVVVLHYYSGMSYEEIESVLGVSGDKVKGRLARARKQIQVHLEREGFRREQ